MAADGTQEKIPGKIISDDPSHDNLSQLEIAKH
jgi:hypothetical protein